MAVTRKRVDAIRRKREEKVVPIKKGRKRSRNQATRIEVVRCDDAYTKLSPGSRGTVTMVDDVLGTVHVRWDDGRTLGRVPGQDEWRPITADEDES